MRYNLLVAASALCAYLLGSLNFGIIVSRVALKIDLRDYGSKNAGSTNAYRVLGPKYAVWVIIGDILKGIAAFLLGQLFAGDYGSLAAMIFVIVGHVYPVYFGFRGGKGVLTAAAVVAVFDWRIFLICIAVFLVVMVCWRYVSLGSMVAAAVLPLNMYLFYPHDMRYWIVGALVGIGVIFLHRANIKRLISKTESKFSFKRQAK